MKQTQPKAVWIDPSPFASLEMSEGILAEAGIAFDFSLCETEDEIIEVAREADALMVVLHNYISRKILESLPECKVIIRHGIGLDNIDVDAATDLGILVCNDTFYCIEEVSDMAMALLLACTRKIALLDRAVRAGIWKYSMARTGYRLRGSTLGLMGLGRVARLVAQKAKGFGLRVIAYDPYVSPEDAGKIDVTLAPLAELLQEADFVSIHMPLTPETKHLIGERELRMMKPTAYLINTARGGIIDTDALLKALDGDWIAGAGLDLIEGVPPLPEDHPLLLRDNVILTPHVAWYSEEATDELQDACARNVVRVLSGEMPRSLANPQVLERPNCRVAGLKDKSAT